MTNANGKDRQDLGTYDVVVVGGGGSGLAAAASAAENGASVLVLEKEPELGGSTGLAVGSLTAAETSYQQRAGIEDNVARHAEDAAKFAQPEIEARNNDPLRRFLIENAAESLHWLRDMGLAFHGPSPEPPNTAPRMHNVVPSAKAYVLALQKRAQKHGARVLTGVRVDRLVKEDGRVTGVEASREGEPVRAEARRGVVLAGGDYSAAPDLISEHKGAEFAPIEGINKTAFGLGHRLAADAGAQLVNMDVTYGPELRFIPPESKSLLRRLPASGFAHFVMGKLVPFAPKPIMNAVIKKELVTWQHPEDALLEDGAIMVNREGKRFCDETDYPAREIAIANQPDKVCFMLLDERLIARYSEWPHFISTAPEIAYAYVEDYLRLRPDVAVDGGSVEEVARKRGLPPEALRETAQGYGRGEDPFGRQGATPLEGHRWVLLGPAKTYFTITEGGCLVNERLEVLGEDDRAIPGLYAAGMNGSGGLIMWGHGLHIAWAITSGRIAGQVLAGKAQLASA